MDYYGSMRHDYIQKEMYPIEHRQDYFPPKPLTGSSVKIVPKEPCVPRFVSKIDGKAVEEGDRVYFEGILDAQPHPEPFSVKMQNVTCNHYMPWKEHAGNHFADPDEAGQVCQFEVENLHATQWQFKEGFTCGNSAKRIVMCEKAFEVFKKAEDYIGFDISHLNPNVWAAIITLVALSILLNFFLIVFIYRLKKIHQNSDKGQQPSRPVYQSALSYEENIIRGNLLRDLSFEGETVITKEEGSK